MLGCDPPPEAVFTFPFIQTNHHSSRCCFCPSSPQHLGQDTYLEGAQSTFVQCTNLGDYHSPPVLRGTGETGLGQKLHQVCPIWHFCPSVFFGDDPAPRPPPPTRTIQVLFPQRSRAAPLWRGSQLSPGSTAYAPSPGTHWAQVRRLGTAEGHLSTTSLVTAAFHTSQAALCAVEGLTKK